MKFIVGMVIFAVVSTMAAVLVLNTYERLQAEKVMERNMGIDIRKIPDGNYRGNYEYVTVDIAFEKGKISAIDILENRNTDYARSAEKITERIIENQMLSVDVITGATFTSEAILKAVEDALIKGSPGK